MEKPVTIAQIARQIGVSTTTINYVLNNKGRVGEETRQLVLEMCKKMNYRPNKAAMSLARKPIRIGVIINSKIPEFHDELIKGVKKAQLELADFKVYGEYFIYSMPNSRQTIIDKMQELGNAGFDGIIVCPSDDIRDYDKIIEALYIKNIPVATIVSDIPNCRRVLSVRTDGRIAGKMAAELLYWFTGGRTVAIFTCYKDRGVHKEAIDGFMEQVKNTPLDIINIFENQDDANIAYYATEKLITEYPETAGIYICSANSLSVCNKILESGLSGKIKIVASDVFPELNKFLKSGVINATIFQDPLTQGRVAFKQLYNYIVSEENSFESEVLVRPQIVLQSNVEYFIGV